MKRILLSFLLLVSTFAQAQLTITPRITPAYFTPQSFGIHVHHPEVAAQFPRAQFGALRMWDGAGTWAEVQPVDGSTWSWTRMDQYLDSFGPAPTMKIMLTFGRTPKWAAADKVTPNAAYGAGAASPPADMDDFRMYVRTLATRYRGRIEAYQTWNEANTAAFWQGTIQQLVDLTCAAYHEIKAADPAALVVMPSGTGAYSPPILFVKQFLDAGGNACVDVYAYHLYTSGSPPETFVQPMLDMRTALVAAGYTKPIWNTETGYLMPGAKVGMYANKVTWTSYDLASRVGDHDAGDFMVRAMLLARAMDFQRFYWYSWDHLKMGLIDPGSKTPNDQADVLRRFRAAFVGNGLVGACVKSATGIWQCPIQVNTTSLRNGQVVWTDPGAANQIQPFTPPYKANMSNFHSDVVTFLPAGTSVNVTPTPQLFIWQ